MPIYEYRCSECGQQKEFLQRMNDAPHTDCPDCGKPALTKLISAAGFQLKGTGWYATDFRNNGAKPGKTQGETAEAGKRDETKSDAVKSDAACGAGACPACT